jgi:hypothetical protein
MARTGSKLRMAPAYRSLRTAASVGLGDDAIFHNYEPLAGRVDGSNSADHTAPRANGPPA